MKKKKNPSRPTKYGKKHKNNKQHTHKKKNNTKQFLSTYIFRLNSNF